MRDQGDLSPEVARAVQAKGRLHLGVSLIVLGLIAVVVPQVMAIPAEVAALARTNSAIMGIIGIVMGVLVLMVRREPRRWTWE